MFRHYYAIVMLDQNGLTTEATQDTGLLADVVKNKASTFPTKKQNMKKPRLERYDYTLMKHLSSN